MVKMKCGLGDIDIEDMQKVAYILDHLHIDEEVSFTADLFSSENLLETVFAALEWLDYTLIFSAGVHKLFFNRDNGKQFQLDCRPDVIIARYAGSEIR